MPENEVKKQNVTVDVSIEDGIIQSMAFIPEGCNAEKLARVFMLTKTGEYETSMADYSNPDGVKINYADDDIGGPDEMRYLIEGTFPESDASKAFNYTIKINGEVATPDQLCNAYELSAAMLALRSSSKNYTNDNAKQQQSGGTNKKAVHKR